MAVTGIRDAARRIRLAVWTDPGPDATRGRRIAVHAARVLWLAAEGYNKDSCFLRASALTLASMLALVPALAASFAIVRGLGWTGQRLESLLLERATSLTPEGVSTVVSLVDHISITGMGLVGVLFAVGSALSLLWQMEAAFDAVWGNTRGRGRVRESADALVLLVLGPMLLALVASGEGAVRSSTVITWLQSFGGFEVVLRAVFALAWAWMVCGTFAALYLFFPASPVSRRSAAIGGLAAGLAWQFAQSIYVEWQIGIGGYNAIYGALAQIPILVFWMWTSWVIVLAGAEIVAADQKLSVTGRHYSSGIGGAASRERLALTIVLELADAAFARRAAPTMVHLAQLVAMPVRNVSEIFSSLCEAGLVHTGGEDQRQCFLSLSPGSISVERVIVAARGDDQPADRGAEKPGVTRVLRRLAELRHEALGNLTLADLVEQQAERSAALSRAAAPAEAAARASAAHAAGDSGVAVREAISEGSRERARTSLPPDAA